MSELLEHAAAMNNLAESNRMLAAALAAGAGRTPLEGRLAGPADTRPSKGPETGKPIAGKATRTKAEVPEPKPEPEAESDAIPYETVKAKIFEVSSAQGREAALKLMAGFRTAGGETVAKGPQLEPADYPAFLEAADKLLAEEPLG